MSVENLNYLDIGLDDVQPWDGTFQTPADGEYILLITDVALRKSRNDNPVLSVEFMVETKVDGSVTDQAGRKLRKTYLLSHTNPETDRMAKARLKNLLDAVGNVRESGGFSPTALKDKEVVGTVSHRDSDLPDKYNPGHTRIFADVSAERSVTPSKT